MAFNFKEMANMYNRNEWNENEKFSLDKIAQDVFSMSEKHESFDHDCKTSCTGNIKTSCCIDTTQVTAGPCSDEIKTSCCIDTVKE